MKFRIKSAILLKKDLIFDSESIYNKKYLKAKIKSYEGKVNTNVHNGKMPREGSHYIFLLVVMIVVMVVLMVVTLYLKLVTSIILKSF